MVDKHLIRKSIDELQSQLKSLGEVALKERGATWKASRELLYAQIGHLIGLSLPPGSPLLALFKKWSDEATRHDALPMDPKIESADPPKTESADPLKVTEEILQATNRWNEFRIEEDASAALAEDVNRILDRKFFGYWVVKLSLAALLVAAVFAIFGVVRFQDMKLDVKGEITKKGEDAIAEIQKRKEEATQAMSEVQKQVRDASSDATKLDRDIASANQRVTDLTISAIRDLTEKKVGALNSAGDSAVTEIGKVRKQVINKIEGAVHLDDITSAETDALEKIRNATDLERLKTALGVAERSIESNAKQFVEEVKVRVAPAFNDAVKQDNRTLQALEQRLAKADNRIAMVDAALRAMGTPDNKIVDKLAGYFNQTVLAVYIVLGLTLCVFFVNLGVMFYLFRRQRRGRVAP